jgi:AraC-like DNA-binding protein
MTSRQFWRHASELAERAGFGSATVLRHHFRAWCATTPHTYRRTFRAAPGKPRARPLARAGPAPGQR